MEWLHVALFCSFVLLSLGEVVEVKVEPLPVKNEVASRIVGGQPTTIERYPFAVQLIYRNSLSCGGSLVTIRHVLTAAHCFYDPQTNALLRITDYTVRAGTRQLNSGGVTRQASILIIHERYNSPLRDNDIAIMVLSRSFTLSTSIGLATLPIANAQLNDNVAVWDIGWGVMSWGSNTASSVLNEVQVFTINITTCASRYLALEQFQGRPGQYTVTSNNLCSGLLDIGGRDACQGDSGGPLVYNNHFVVGVTAWGYECAHPTYPGVNMRTSAYTDWISRTVNTYNASPNTKASAGLLLTLVFAVIFFNKM